MWWISLSVIFFKFRYYKNVNITNFVYYGKTRMKTFQVDTSPHRPNLFSLMDHAFTLADWKPNTMNLIGNDICNKGDEIVLPHRNQSLFSNHKIATKLTHILYSLKGIIAKMILWKSSIWRIPEFASLKRFYSCRLTISKYLVKQNDGQRIGSFWVCGEIRQKILFLHKYFCKMYCSMRLCSNCIPVNWGHNDLTSM